MAPPSTHTHTVYDDDSRSLRSHRGCGSRSSGGIPAARHRATGKISLSCAVLLGTTGTREVERWWEVSWRCQGFSGINWDFSLINFLHVAPLYIGGRGYPSLLAPPCGTKQIRRWGVRPAMGGCGGHGPHLAHPSLSLNGVAGPLLGPSFRKWPIRWAAP